MATPTNTPEQKTTKLGIENPVYTTDLKTGSTSFLGEGYVKPAPQAPEQTVQPTENVPTPNFKDQRTTSFEPAPVPFTDITKKETPQGTIKQKTTPVTLKSGQEVQLNAQEMKMREQNLKAQENQINQQEKQAKMTDLGAFLAGNPTKESVNRYLKVNYKPEYKLDYQNALRNYYKQSDTNTKIQKYSVAPVEVIDEAVMKGDLVPGTDAYNNLTPEKRAEYENYAKVKQASTITDPYVAPKTDFTTILNGLKDVFSTSYQKEFQDKLNSNEKLQMNKDLENIANEIDKIDTDIATMAKDRAKVNKGVPSSLQNAENADKQEALLLKKNTLINQYNSKKATLDSYKADIETELELIKADDENNKQAYMTALSLYNTERARMDAVEQRAFEEQSKIRAEERQRTFQKEILEIQNKYEQANKTPKYELGRDGKMYAIVDGMATEVMATTGEVLFGEENETMSTSVQRNDDGTYTVFQIPKKGGTPQITTYGASGEIASGNPLAIQDIINNCQAKGQCGAGVNDYLQNLGVGRVMGDSYESKFKNVNSQTPQIGGVAIWNPQRGQGKFKEYGHTGIVTGYNEKTGKVTITDWNWNGDEKQLTHEVNLSEITYNGGFYNPIPETQEYTQSQMTVLGSIGNPTDANALKVLESAGLSVEDWGNFKSNDTKGNAQIAQELITLANELKVDEGRFGASTGLWRIPRTDANAYKQKFDKFKSSLALQQLVDMKNAGATFGALSNQELQFLTDSATSLNLSSQDAVYQAELDRIINKLSNSFPQLGNATQAVEQTVQQTPQTGGLLQEYNSRPKLDIDN